MIKSDKGNFSFLEFTNDFISNFYSPRQGEFRVGDSLKTKNGKGRFVILGIEESIGPMANNGLSGSELAFASFLKVFLNSQIHEQFDGSNFYVLGTIKQESLFSSVSNASEQVLELDDFVFRILNKHVSQDQIPIVIGGGHNNAYPLIKWSASHGIINVLNLDPHADCREISSRHSGNSFSFALEQKILNGYAVFGLHEAFNNHYIRKFLVNHKVLHTFYEEYLIQERDLLQDLLKLTSEWKNQAKIGLEIDMDSIASMPSSAFSPSGWTIDQVRTYLITAASNFSKIAYLHLPEAAPKNEIENKITGKALAYLVRDFIKNAN
jgi:formiminoglutamase